MTKKYSINSEILSTNTDDELIVLNIDTEKYMSLNKTAYYIYNLIVEGVSDEKSILNAIKKSYKNFDTDKAKEVKDFLELAEKKGLIIAIDE